MRTPRRVGYEEAAKILSGFGESADLMPLQVPVRPQYGHVSYQELTIICEIARCIKPKRIFEFGRFDGVATLNLATTTPEATIVTLDLPDEKYGEKDAAELPSDEIAYYPDAPQRARKRWKAAGVKERITEILMDSACFDPREYDSSSLLGQVNLVLVDANHSYEYIKRDTEKAVEMLAPGGVIIWHDYFKRSFPGVTAYLAELAERKEILWFESRKEYLETGLCIWISSR